MNKLQCETANAEAGNPAHTQAATHRDRRGGCHQAKSWHHELAIAPCHWPLSICSSTKRTAGESAVTSSDAVHPAAQILPSHRRCPICADDGARQNPCLQVAAADRSSVALSAALAAPPRRRSMGSDSSAGQGCTDFTGYFRLTKTDHLDEYLKVIDQSEGSTSTPALGSKRFVCRSTRKCWIAHSQMTARFRALS